MTNFGVAAENSKAASAQDRQPQAKVVRTNAGSVSLADLEKYLSEQYAVEASVSTTWFWGDFLADYSKYCGDIMPCSISLKINFNNQFKDYCSLEVPAKDQRKYGREFHLFCSGDLNGLDIPLAAFGYR
jgi:hypothetical protein